MVKSEDKSSSKIDYAIDIVELSKEFRRQTLKKGGYTTLKSSLSNLFSSKRSAEHEVTRAVSNITIRVPQGASLGVIGRNGSGKSTLLKLITGIYSPSTGRVSVNGRVAALIELGAGFHPDFTGRENLMLGGIMLGLTREEISSRFDTIVDFAGLEKVIDDPVRTYSSGMFMRLGFSLAVHSDPDVLLVDEVLAVGDAAFVRRCKERVSELRREGKTLLLVSHDLDAIERWCDEVIWLHEGKVKDRGDPRRVIDHYREFLEKGEEQEIASEQPSLSQSSSSETDVKESGISVAAERWGSREIEISKVELKNQQGESHHLFHTDDSVDVEIHYAVNDPLILQKKNEVDGGFDLVFGIGITRGDGILVHGTNTQIDQIKVGINNKTGVVNYKISRLALLEGRYVMDIAVHRFDGYPYDYRKGFVKFAVRSERSRVGVFSPESEWGFKES